MKLNFLITSTKSSKTKKQIWTFNHKNSETTKSYKSIKNRKLIVICVKTNIFKNTKDLLVKNCHNEKLNHPDKEIRNARKV